MKTNSKTLFFILILMSLVSMNALSQDLKKIAIVFGMSDYLHASKLVNTLNDADDMSGVLRSLKFDVIEYKNSTLVQMQNQIDDLQKKLSNYDVALFYFSGHGAEINGENFLFPIDANPRYQADVRFSAFSTNSLIDILESSKIKTKIILLDACRDNPFTKSWTKGLGNSSEGLSIINPTLGTFIGFATSPGKVAYANGSRNSPYTSAILKIISKPNITVDQIFNRVNYEVRKTTNSEQIPFKVSSFESDFYFSKSKSFDNNDIEEDEKDQNKVVLDNVKNLLFKIPFGSSIGDVLAFEWGESQRNAFSYSSLPQSTECTNNEIKYYWRYLNESSMKPIVENFLVRNNLQSYVTKDAYMLYVFRNNKLIRIQIRLTFNDIAFHNKLASALAVNTSKYPSQFFFKDPELYTVVFVEENFNVSQIAIGEASTSNFCNVDWWSTK